MANLFRSKIDFGLWFQLLLSTVLTYNVARKCTLYNVAGQSNSPYNHWMQGGEKAGRLGLTSHSKACFQAYEFLPLGPSSKS